MVGKNGKPDWATKKDPLPPVPALTNALAAKCMTSSAPTSVTVSHEDYAHLLKLAHERPPYHLLLSPIKVAQILYSHPPARSLSIRCYGSHDMSLSSFLISLADGNEVPSIPHLSFMMC